MKIRPFPYLICYKIKFPSQKQCYVEYIMVTKVFYTFMDVDFSRNIMIREEKSISRVILP